MNNKLIVIMGPCGSGKSTLYNNFINQFKDEYVGIPTYTTRKRRGDESDNSEKVFKHLNEVDVHSIWAKFKDPLTGLPAFYWLDEAAIVDALRGAKNPVVIGNMTFLPQIVKMFGAMNVVVVYIIRSPIESAISVLRRGHKGISDDCYAQYALDRICEDRAMAGEITMFEPRLNVVIAENDEGNDIDALASRLYYWIQPYLGDVFGK